MYCDEQQQLVGIYVGIRRDLSQFALFQGTHTEHSAQCVVVQRMEYLH